ANLLGLEHDLRVKKVEDDLYKWSKEYGTAYKLPGCFGGNILMISDPRAIHCILQESVNDFPLPADFRKRIEIFFGKGVVWAIGVDHKRHRRILGPAFTINHTRKFLPLFQSHVNILSEKWNSELQGGKKIIDIVPWLQKAALDIIGESVFDYHFDALQDKPNELTETLHDLEKLGLNNSPTITLVQGILRYIPAVLVGFLSNIPAFEDFLTLSNRMSPINSIVRANRAQDPRKRLSEHEMLSQISTLIQAGHHTTGYAVSWILYELAAHPKDQMRVYEEIRRTRVRTSGDFTASDYDSMSYLTCVIKESLRLRPPVPILEREASKNSILPLDFAIISVDGKTIEAIPVIKGQRIQVNVSGYNRLEEVWGKDANTWNPGRFDETAPDPKLQTQVGLFGNVMTFSEVLCFPGYFTLISFPSIVTGLLERYEFSIPPGVEIEGGNLGSTALIAPIVKGKEMKGPQAPLMITPRC
ncbi:cytochrome P450, partial [Marasmius fiardii PR-910]